MGTRNLTMVLLNNEIKLAQYCQWDGYLEGQGQEIVKFLKQENLDLEKFKKNIMRCKDISEKEHRALWKELGADDSGFVSIEQSEKFKKKYPLLHRDAGSEALQIINDSEGEGDIHISLLSDFIVDSLFCEWAYLIDLDNNNLEIYRGFQKEPLKEGERFYHLNEKSNGEYYPCSMVAKYSFSELTLETLPELDKELHGDEDEEEE